MRKEIAPELYNYNKFPGPSFRLVGDKVVADQLEFSLVENVKEAFDATVFSQRFSEILTKYDYLVGDWGNDQLRLRGFYKDEKTQEAAAKISRLEDYLLEYCNYGCAYFVLENKEPRRAAFDKKSYDKKSPKKEEGSKQRRDRKKQQAAYKQRQNSRPKKKRDRREEQAGEQGKRHFVIRWKG